MRNHFVSVELHDVERNEARFYAQLILLCPKVSRAMTRMFVAEYDGTSEELRDALQKTLGTKDRLMIIGPDMWASCNLVRDALPMLLDQ